MDNIRYNNNFQWLKNIQLFAKWSTSSYASINHKYNFFDSEKGVLLRKILSVYSVKYVTIFRVINNESTIIEVILQNSFLYTNISFLNAMMLFLSNSRILSINKIDEIYIFYPITILFDFTSFQRKCHHVRSLSKKFGGWCFPNIKMPLSLD